MDTPSRPVPPLNEGAELEQILNHLIDAFRIAEHTPLRSAIQALNQYDKTKAEILQLIATAEREARLKDWQEFWQFWIDPLNDDMEAEQFIKDKLAELSGEETTDNG